MLGLGGIASVTYLPPAAPADRVLAFHAGPANMVIDETVRALTAGRTNFDAGGRWPPPARCRRSCCRT